MGLRVNTNVAALNVQRNLGRSQEVFSRSLSRLSSGLRISTARDDTAGLSIANNLRAQVSGYKVASRNASQASAFAQTAEGAASEISNILNRLRELAVSSASDQNDSASRTALDNERSQLVSEINRIADATEFNGSVLVNGTLGVDVDASTVGSGINPDDGVQSISTSGVGTSVLFTITQVTGTSITLTREGGSTEVENFTLPTGFNTATVNFGDSGVTMVINAAFSVTSAEAGTAAAAFRTASSGTSTSFQVGPNNGSNNAVTLTTSNLDLNTAALSITGDVTTQSNADTYISTIDAAITSVNTALGDLGAFQNRVGFAAANVAAGLENTSAAESVIRDADIASETTDYTKAQILVQAGVAILSQANLAAQSALTLLNRLG